jgi:hypothetical protein
MQLEMKYFVGKEIELRKNVNEDECGRVHFIIDGIYLLLILLLTMLREL